MTKFLNILFLKDKKYFSAFFIMFIISFSFAIYTNHAWEDWYITYRASKNLATGNGLVFTVGERVHSFTSPIGTLVPSLISYATFNYSDTLVLWIYRIFCCFILSCAAAILTKYTHKTNMTPVAALVMVGIFCLDAKIIDFSINGMETAFMMFFLIMMIYVSFIKTKRFSLFSGIAWAGLMWTRPDSVIYILSFCAGIIIFKGATPYSDSRYFLTGKLLKAGCIALIFYIPWVIWAWIYYGSPIPHTIVAKGLFVNYHITELLIDFIKFPVSILSETTAVDDIFMPSYYYVGGWPKSIAYITKILAITASFYWLLPWGKSQAKVVSFVLFVGCFYLTTVGIRAPWYFPNLAILSIFVAGQIFQHFSEFSEKINISDIETKKKLSFASYCLAVSLLLLSGGLTVATAYQVELEQRIVENGNRKLIGLWLKENASSTSDTVFSEGLGYIGFFSQLKMYDWPGLASPEVVKVRRDLNTDDFGMIILALKPDWLVLHTAEIMEIEKKHPLLLTTLYNNTRSFDVSRKVADLGSVPGKPFIQSYQKYMIFKKTDKM